MLVDAEELYASPLHEAVVVDDQLPDLAVVGSLSRPSRDGGSAGALGRTSVDLTQFNADRLDKATGVWPLCWAGIVPDHTPVTTCQDNTVIVIRYQLPLP